MKLTLLTSLTAILSQSASVSVSAQEYQNYQDYAEDDYSNDNLYSSFAAKDDSSSHQKPAKPASSFFKSVALGGTGWLVGAKIHSARTIQKMKTKHMKDQKNLYSQYYNDVYKLQQQNAELAYVVEQYQDAIHNVAVEMDNDQLKRDYDEFKQPDVDGDDRISRAEFSMYVKNYLSNYPGLTEKDYPRFEDFDHDGDGFIGFQEYAQQMALTIQKAEQDKSSKLTY